MLLGVPCVQTINTTKPFLHLLLSAHTLPSVAITHPGLALCTLPVSFPLVVVDVVVQHRLRTGLGVRAWRPLLVWTHRPVTSSPRPCSLVCNP